MNDLDQAENTAATIRNARLADGRVVDLVVDADGRIQRIDAHDEQRTAPGDGPVEGLGEVHDLGGWLVLPAMAEPHAHLDKALTADLVPNVTGDLHGAIDAWVSAAERGEITHDGIVERAAAAMDLLLVHGVTAVRTHVNVVSSTGAAAVAAIREAIVEFGDVLDIQVVALVGAPVSGPEGAALRRHLATAIEMGVDLVGGCPHLEADGPGVIDVTMSAALDAGLPMDLHVDETLDPTMLTLRDYAERVIDTGFPHGVAASHCVSLGLQSADVQAEVAARVAEAGMAVFPLPQTNLFLQGREHQTAMPRALTAVRALLEAGVTVAAGGDNVQDPFNLVGRSDPLETAALMVMAGHQSPESAYAMVSNNARLAMGLAPVNFEVGDPADLVAIDAPTVRAAIADAPMSRRVFRHGRLVASCDQQTTVNR